MDKCAPKYKNNGKTCFTLEALNIIIDAYNRNMAKNNNDKIIINSNETKEKIWKKIQTKLEKVCDENETCWIEQSFLREYPYLDKYFKPKAPNGRYKWLSSTDINKVMKQYEEICNGFKYVGALPIDFANLQDNDSKYLNGMNIKKEREKGYNNIAVIFNLDPSTKNGSHWVAFHICLKDNVISYYDSTSYYKNNDIKNQNNNKYNITYIDSYGKVHINDKYISMPVEVQELVKKLQKQETFYIRVNTIQHQYANSECGIYCISFILGLIESDFDTMTKKIMSDEEANTKRNIYFRYS